MNELRKGASEISTRTQNRVQFKFYPGGVMGEDAAVIRKMKLGQLHGGAFTNGSLAEIYPDVQIYNLVMKFRSYDEVDYIRKTLDARIIEGLREKGFEPFGFSEIGFAYLMSTNPIRTLDDLKKQKAWIPENNHIALEAVKAFSVTPTPLPIRDVLVGLQTGMVNTVAASPTAALLLQWHTQVKYVTDLPVSYIYGFLAIDRSVFEKIADADRAVVREVMKSAAREIDARNRKDNEDARKLMEKQGIQFLKLATDDVKALDGLVVQANRNLMTTGRVNTGTVDDLDRLLAEYRTQVKRPDRKL